MYWQPYVVVGMGVILGVVLPWATIAALEPTLEAGPTVRNFRGRSVHSGLGAAWLVWSIVAIAAGLLCMLVLDSLIGFVLPIAGLLALVAFALGLFDDTYGSGESRGFKGHLGQLAKGRLTTGGLKLAGISAASYMAALVLGDISSWGSDDPAIWYRLLLAVPAGAAIALTCNFVNLADLRPGRASKAYAVLATAGLLSVTWGIGDMLGLISTDLLALALFLAGPVLATWGPDLGERGMLGDAGANAAGAVAGMLIVIGLPLWGMLAYTLFMLALNFASERFSFSQLIDRTRFLRALDRLGRLPDEEAQLTSEPTEPSDHTEITEER